MLQKKSKRLEVVSGHGSHKQYNDAISEKITKKANLGKPEKAFEEIQELIKSTKSKLKEEVLLGSKDVSDIIDF